MSYLEEIKQEVEDKRQEILDSYKRFVTDYLVTDFAKTEDNTALVEVSLLVSEGICPEAYEVWLTSNGFIVSKTKQMGFLKVTYNP